MTSPGKRRLIWFQFLIGRLGTPFIRDQELKMEQFQFLIGRLGTRSPDQYLLLPEWFQFLIGRLGTVKSLQNQKKRG